MTLKPCPFCGGAPLMHHGHGDITYITCDQCGAVVSFRPNFKGSAAVAAWNERAAQETGLCGCTANPCAREAGFPYRGQCMIEKGRT